ncbi:MAG: DUF2089 family protein [Bacteroidales bacterium]
MLKKMPLQCPSCSSPLEVKTLQCAQCATTVNGHFPLPLLASLEADDQSFVIEFVKSSGSLKEMARHLGLSYPSVRNRLDELISKIKNLENSNP